MRRTARCVVSLFVPRGKFAISFLIFLIIFPLFLPLLAVGQEASPPTTTVTQTQYSAEVPKDENSAMQVRLINVLSAISCQIAGINPAYPNRKCVGIDRVTEKVSFLPQETNQQQVGGAIGFVNTMMDTMYAVPAASTGDYLTYLGDNFGIAKKVHAQGVGFSSLSPILPLWTASRNIAYMFYILAFIVIGMLIMIRVRLDPRTVMTIQNQIPKIVVGIILITFSYALAGFLIDLMYTSMYVLTNIVTSVQVPIAGELDANGKPVLHTYTELGPGIISASNPFVAADRMSDKRLTLHNPIPIANWVFDPTISSGFGGLIEGPAVEIGEALGKPFDGPLGGWVKGIISGVILGLAAKNVAQTAGASGTTGKILGGLGLALGLASLIAPEIGLPAQALIPILIGTAGAAKTAQSLRAGTTQGKFAAGAYVAATLLGAYEANKVYGAAQGNEKSIQDSIFTVIAFIILAVAVLSSLIRLWFSLMKAYILILLNIILAPFYILFGLFPGSGWSFNTWLRTMCAHLAVFPVVVVVFVVARIIMDGLGPTQSQGVFVPPFLGNASIAGTIQSIVGLTFLLVMPAIVDMIRGIFQSKPSPYTGPAISPGIAAGVGYATGLAKNPLAIMSQSEEARVNPDTGLYEKTGTFRAVTRRILG